MEENRVKTFYDITARRWNDIINAVNSRRPADSIEPPLDEHELAEFRKMEAEKVSASGIFPFMNLFVAFDIKLLDILRKLVWEHGIYTFFASIGDGSFVIPAFELKKGKCFLKGFYLSFDG